MNLAEHDLLPLKTKAITVGGQRALFCGMDRGPDYKYCWALTAPYEGIIMFGTNEDGAHPSKNSISIAKIIPIWEPRVGDVVKVIGLMGELMGASRGWQYSSGRSEYTIQGIGDLITTTHPEYGTWRTHPKQLRLVRRGGSA